MGFRGIFTLLLLSPAYLWGQSADTSQTVLDEVEIVEEAQQQRSNLRNVEGTSIYAGKKTEVVNQLLNTKLSKEMNMRELSFISHIKNLFHMIIEPRRV